MIQKIRMDMSIGSNIQKRRYQCKLKQDQVIAKMNLNGYSDLQEQLCQD